MSHVVVVGAGLAGLSTAALLAKGGAEVTVVERRRGPGGRAASTVHAGGTLNLGAHALYRGGALAALLADLDVPWRGSAPPTRAAVTLDGACFAGLSAVGEAVRAPRAAWQVAAAVAGLRWADPERWRGRTVHAWLDEIAPEPAARRLLAALVRTSCYAHPAHDLDAAAVIEQLRIGTVPGVAYVHGGWGALVEGLRARAEALGVRVRTGEAVRGLRKDGDTVCGVVLGDGTTLPADAVVLTVPPAAAEALVPALEAPRRRLVPGRVACLDLVLDALPRPDRTIALDLEWPLFMTVPSAVAEVSTDGAVVVQALEYLAPGAPPASAARLESWLDGLQPGWRSGVRHRRFLPTLDACSALPVVGAGRRLPVQPGPVGLFLAGDGVGDPGQLADTAAASARQASRAVLADLARGRLAAR